MDNLLDKFELHDFFGVLLPGMTFIIMLYFMYFSTMDVMIFTASQVFNVIVFVLASYISGTLIQECASFIDENWVKIRINAREKFLDINSPLFKGEELQEVKKVTNKLLKKDESNNSFTRSECSKVYFECKAFLENNDKMDEANKFDAVYEMSRNFVVCNLCVLVCLFYILFKTSNWMEIYSIILVYISVSTVIFGKRTIRYSEMRVRKILRRYIDLKRSNEI